MADTALDADLRRILTETRVIALVGASADPSRPSAGVLAFLVAAGYRVYAVNPGLAAGSCLFGAPVVARMADVPEAIDMVDVFRRSEAAGAVVDEALALDPPPKTIWMQLGVVDEAAAARARARGVAVVMDRCPKIDHRRLGL